MFIRRSLLWGITAHNNVEAGASSGGASHAPRCKQGKNRAPMNESRWRVELKAAATDKDVLNVARDYVALLAGEHLEDLPRDLRPGPLPNWEGVSEWALKLVQAGLSLAPNEAGVARPRE